MGHGVGVKEVLGQIVYLHEPISIFVCLTADYRRLFGVLGSVGVVFIASAIISAGLPLSGIVILIVPPAPSVGRARMVAFLLCPISAPWQICEFVDGQCPQKSRAVSLQRQPEE